MKLNRGYALILMVLVATLLISTAIAQETTGGIQGTVKDPQGLVVSKAVVEVSGTNLIGTKKVETDASGYYRFANLPPGDYTLTVTAPNFRTLKQTGLKLDVGKLPTIDLKLEVGTLEQTVEVSSAAPLVDVATSKVQTNVTQDVLESVPTGRSFQSVIAFAPGARQEPLQGGYQIDGASNTENAYLIEGQETASGFDGHSSANMPIEFIQEVQVKSSGFEAEHGGALGGVVNVVTKRGSNAWHGSLFFNYEGDSMDAAGSGGSGLTALPGNVFNTTANSYQSLRALRVNPGIGINAGGAPRLDSPAQYYTPKKDHYRYITPGFEAGGYLIKDRLWLFASYAPEYLNQSRTTFWTGPAAAGGVNINANRRFDFNQATYYSMDRLDYRVSQKIRVFGSWQYQYSRTSGNTFPGADDIHGALNTTASSPVDNYNHGLGAVYPNVIYGTGADITLTPSLISTTRYGYYYFDNGQTRGIPVGIRYYYRDTNYPYSTGNAAALAGSKGLDGTTLPSAYVNTTNWSNIGANTGTAFDQWKKYSLNEDVAYFKKGFLGTHNFKFGYAFNRGVNNIISGYQTADVYVGFPNSYTPTTTVGTANCNTIVSQNTTWWGAAAGAKGCIGNFGTVNLRELGTTGKVGGNNHAFYAQDAWTIGTRLTLNVGVRLDKEALPTYIAGFQGINFGWGDKVAPRLGASYDLLGNGKVKLYGSYGYFFDIMKYQLPRGSFGGDYWHDCVYAMDSPNFYNIQPVRGADGHYCPLGGTSQATGNLPAATTGPTSLGLRFIENTDYRQPANDPNSFESLGKTGLVDPNLKPMKQHEMVVGMDWAVSPTLAFETRYSRKRLDRTIEDTGIITANGEQYYISNPGEGANAVIPAILCSSACPGNPKARRDYDGLEFRLTKRPTDGKWFGALAYTWSRLYGNYSGLTATDVSDGGGARNGANSDRAFDEAFMQFDSHGKLVDGPLGTDRPNAVKAMGYYRLKWWKFNTLIGGFQQFSSGTPLSSYVSVWGAPVFVEGRGKFVDMTRNAAGQWVKGAVSQKRTDAYIQTDLNLLQEFHVSKTNERMLLGFEANVTNLFNQHAVTYVNQNLIKSGSIHPAQCGATGITCTTTAVNQAGFDYYQIIKGYDYVASANYSGTTIDPPSTTGNILNSLYGMPYGWQGSRSMRFKLSFKF